MKFCGDDCVACCDFCKHVIYGSLEVDGTTGPVACSLHQDEEHRQIAEDCGFCDDFYCFRAE